MANNWCAVCGGSPDRKIADTVAGGMPRCEVCAAGNLGILDWDPRARRKAPQIDGNAARRHENPEAWERWIAFSEACGHP